MSINTVTLSGNLTRDSELRASAAGNAILNFGVAVNDRQKNQQTGEWEDMPNFFNCTMFGRRAETLAQYLTKGIKVTVQGKLSQRSYEKNGEKRSSVSIIVNELEFMSRNVSQNASGATQAHVNGYSQPTYAAPGYGASNQHTASQPDFASDDIPF